jgi:hypothetical protein
MKHHVVLWRLDVKGSLDCQDMSLHLGAHDLRSVIMNLKHCPECVCRWEMGCSRVFAPVQNEQVEEDG